MVCVFVDSKSVSACLVHYSTCASMRADFSLRWAFSLIPSVRGQRLGMCMYSKWGIYLNPLLVASYLLHFSSTLLFVLVYMFTHVCPL